MTDEEARSRVVDAATELMTSEGIGAATYERLAKLAGVRERQIRRIFPELDELRREVLSVPQVSEVAELVARAAASQEPLAPLALLVEAGHRLYANAASSWSVADLEALLRAKSNPELRDVAAERIHGRIANARTVIQRGADTAVVDDALSPQAITFFLASMSVGLAMIDAVSDERPTIAQWDALMARIGVAFASPDPGAGIDIDSGERWRLLVSIPDRPRALSRLIRALGAMDVYVNDVRVEESREGPKRKVFLGLLAPQDVSADVLLAAAQSAGSDAYIARGVAADARDLISRTLDGATHLVRFPDSAPQVAARLVAADSFEVVDAAEGVSDQPGLLRLQWTAHRHVLLRRDWCPFTRSEQVRASALLRLSAAIARMAGDEDANGWIDAVKGGTVWIRLARPEDADAVAEMHDRCSERTRYLRYFATVEWRDIQMRRLAGGHRGASLVAMSRDGRIVGLGNVFPEGAPQDRTAEIALLVEDAHQGEGIGRALITRMLQLAGRLGFTHVSAHLFADNLGIKRLLEWTGLPWRTTVSGGVADMIAPLPGR